MINYIQVANFDNKQVVINKEHEALYLRLNNFAKIEDFINIFLSYETDNIFYIEALQMIRKYLELVTYDDFIDSKDDYIDNDDDFFDLVLQVYISNLLDLASILNNHEILKSIDVLLEAKIIYLDLNM